MAGRLAAAQKAVELGYAIEPDKGPSGKLDHWRITGIPTETADLFSKRADAIQEELEQAGFRSYRARGIAARNIGRPRGTSRRSRFLSAGSTSWTTSDGRPARSTGGSTWSASATTNRCAPSPTNSARSSSSI